MPKYVIKSKKRIKTKRKNQNKNKNKSHNSKRKKKITKKLLRYKKKGGSRTSSRTGSRTSSRTSSRTGSRTSSRTGSSRPLPRSNYCRYREPSGTGQKQERTMKDCRQQGQNGYPCRWGNKFNWKTPLSSHQRCYEASGERVRG